MDLLPLFKQKTILTPCCKDLTSIGSSRYPKPSLGLAARCKISSSDPNWLLASSGLRTPPSGHLDRGEKIIGQTNTCVIPVQFPIGENENHLQKKHKKYEVDPSFMFTVSSLSPHTFGHQQSKPALTIKLQT